MPLIQSEQPLPPLLAGLLAMVIAFLLGPPAVASMSRDDSRPDLGDGIDAWFLSRAAVDELHVPTTEETRLDDESPEFRSVSVILRFRGQIIGVGDAAGLGRETLHRALTEAVINARQSKRVRELPIQLIESIGRGTTIELELGGEPVPILGETIQDVADNLRPGVDGLAIRRGDRWSYLFPGRMQAFGQADRPNRALIRLMRDAELPPRNPGELKRLEDIGFYRFEVLTLTQDEPDGAPFETIRGAKRVFIQSDEELRRAAEAIARGCIDCIRGRLASDPEKVVGEVSEEQRLVALGLFGDYDFVQDEFDPLVASSADQALVAWALARYANHDPTLTNPGREQLADLANLLLERIGVVDGIEEPPLENPITPSLITLASLEIEDAEAMLGIEYLTPAICEEARAQVIDQAKTVDSAQRKSGITLSFLNLAARALEKAAPGTFKEARLEQLTELAWSAHTSQTVAGSLPWLLIAERHRTENSADRRWPLTIQVINALIANQIGHADSMVSDVSPVEDLTGGFVTAGASRTTATASSLRPALALSVAIRTPSEPLTPEVEQAWRTANRRGVRFIRQLQITPEQAPRTAVPKRALGAIKRAPWSNVTTLGDSALGLLLATELIMDLDGSSGNSAKIDGTPP